MIGIARKQAAYGLLILFILLGALIGTRLLLVPMASPASPDGVVWLRYMSSNAKISFDYPASWNITDQEWTGVRAGDQNETQTYDSLWACPPDSELVAGEKGGVDNCIIFFTKSRILHPPAESFDEAGIFVDFNGLIQDSLNQKGSGNKMEQNPSSGLPLQINLTGVYQDQENLVGLTQSLCAVGQDAECELNFQHVLNSVQFLN